MSTSVSEEENLRCRLCLADEVDELISLHCQCATQDKLIVDMITEMTRFHLCQENDGLPQHICGQCLARLNTACAYQQTSRESADLYCTEAKFPEQCCRTCLRDDVDELISVLCISGSSRKLVADMLRDACGVVRPVGNDGLPQHICGECFQMLCDAYAFRSMALKSDFIMKKNLKEEVEQEEFTIDDYVKPELVEENSTALEGELCSVSNQSTSGVRKRVDLKNEIDLNWIAESKRMKLSPTEDVDPFIYLDSANIDVERLAPLLLINEDTEYYDQLLFSGIICCCQKLTPNNDEWENHCKLAHSIQNQPSSSKIDCKICHKTFQHAPQLKQHLENRSENLFYRCKICDVMTKKKESLLQHFEFTRFHPLLHNSEPDRLIFNEKVETEFESSSKCCGCLEPFESGEALLEHIETVHYPNRDDQPKFQCFSCYKSFPNNRSLFKHQLTFKITKIYRCKKPQCEFQTVDSLSEIKEHVETDVHQYNAVEFFCCFYGCYDTFETDEALEHHCLNDHAEQRIMNGTILADIEHNVCRLCNRHFPSSSAYKNHIQAQYDRKYMCTTCGRKFPSHNAVRKHEKKSHSNDDRPVFACDRCGANFVTNGNLVMHIKRIHDGDLPELCTICGKRFAHKWALRQHEMNKHMENKPHKCPESECSMSFGSKILLQRHITTHTKDRRYTCSYCGFTYRYSTDMKRHINAIHLDKKPFKCKECDARFIRERDLRLHTIRHTKEKLFKCSAKQCDFATNIRKDLDAHWNEQHEDSDS